MRGILGSNLNRNLSAHSLGVKGVWRNPRVVFEPDTKLEGGLFVVLSISFQVFLGFFSGKNCDRVLLVGSLWQDFQRARLLNLSNVIHQSLIAFFSFHRYRPDAAQVANDEGLFKNYKLVAPEPLDQGSLEEYLALLDVVLFEDLKKGRTDLVEVHLVLFLLEDLYLLREQE